MCHKHGKKKSPTNFHDMLKAFLKCTLYISEKSSMDRFFEMCLFFTDPYKFKTTGDIVCGAAIPFNRTGAVSGVMLVTFKTDVLSK